MEGLCPFHSEKTPSFKVFSDHYHCFGCGAHGNALGFAMGHHGMGFLDAVKMVASRAGVALPADDGPDWDPAEKEIRDVLRYACARYQQALLDKRGTEAMSELARRGVDEDTIFRFGIGYAPEEWGYLSADRKLSQTALLAAGLVSNKKDDKKGVYDFFRGRLMFPVREAGGSGDVIGFGARSLVGNGPKYLNSPETEVYRKGRVLFGWPQAAGAIRQSGSVIVCEGFFDVIVPSQAGIENIVSTCGTALTSTQAEFLLASADSVVFCFDGDAAGSKATWRAAEMLLPLLQDQHVVRMCRLPEGHDPDSLVREGGADALRSVVDSAPSLCEYLVREILRGARIPEARARAFRKLATLARSVSSPVIATFFRQFACDALELSIAEFQALTPDASTSHGRACPCCAREMAVTEAHGGWRIECSHCGLTTPVKASAEDALLVWNRREKPFLDIRKNQNEEKKLPRIQRGDACAVGA